MQRLILLFFVCSFVLSYQPADNELMTEVVKGEILIIGQKNHQDIEIYKSNIGEWIKTQVLETANPIEQFYVIREILVILDQNGFLNLYKFQKTQLKPISFENLPTSISKNLLYLLLAPTEEVKNISKEENNLSEHLQIKKGKNNIKFCPNQMVLIHSESSLQSFMLEGKRLYLKQKLDITSRQNIWEVSQDCQKVTLLGTDEQVLTLTRNAKEQYQLQQVIKEQVEEQILKIKTNQDGTLLVLEKYLELKIFIQEEGKFKFVKSIPKKEGQIFIGVHQESLILKNGDILTQLTPLHEKAQKQLIQSNERILQTINVEEKSDLIFEDSQTLDNYGAIIYSLKLEDNNLLVGSWNGTIRLYIHDGKNFNTNWTHDHAKDVRAVELDSDRKWIFMGDEDGLTKVFKIQGDSYTEKQTIAPPDDGSYTWSIDLNANGYLAINYMQVVSIKKWDSSQFVHQLDIPVGKFCYGMAMCSDDTLIFTAPENGDSYFYAYKKQDGVFSEAQKIMLESQATQYSLAATSDCNVVVASSWRVPSTVFQVLIKNQQNLFEVFKAKQNTANSYYSIPSINEEGDLIALPGKLGLDLWKYSSESNDYQLESTFEKDQQVQRLSSGLNNQFLVFSTNSGEVKVSQFAYTVLKSSETSTFGLKQQLALLDQTAQISVGGRVNDIKISGDHIAISTKYSGSFLYKKGDTNYDLWSNFNQSLFITSIDLDVNLGGSDDLGLLVEGSSSKEAFVNLDFVANDNLLTDSQILDVDFNSNRELVMGHMNGAISYWTWDGQSTFTAESNFTNEGGRAQAVHICEDGRVLAVVEEAGEFYFKIYFNRKIVDYKLDELIGVHMAATDDCSIVTLSCTFLMRVEVYRLQDGDMVLFKIVQESFPLSAISLNPDGDIFVVARHADASAAIYKYDTCTDIFQRKQIIQGQADIDAISATADQLALAGGTVAKIHNYTFSTTTCDSFGKKLIGELLSAGSVEVSSRPITSISVSASFILVASKYSGFSLYNNATSLQLVKAFSDQQFVSDVALVADLSTFVVGSYDREVLVYRDVGEGYELDQTLELPAQVLYVDLTAENKLVAGLINGDVVQFSVTGGKFEGSAQTISHEGGRVYGVKMCEGGKKVVLLEEDGVFELIFYAADGSQQASFSKELADEYIEVYLASTPDCSIVAVSGITMSKVQVFQDSSLFQTINVAKPLSQVAVNPDGDILTVGSITEEESFVFQYILCEQLYFSYTNISSGSFDVALAMTGQMILQGNEVGSISLSSYEWTFFPMCLTAEGGADGVREKMSNQGDFLKKVGTIDGSYEQINASFSGGDIWFVAIFIAVMAALLFFLYKNAKRQNLSDSPETEAQIQKAIQE